MSIATLNGINAYSRAAGRPIAPSISADDSSSVSGGDINNVGGFAGLLGNLAKDAGDAVRHSEAVSRQSVTGKADLVDVVQAVNQAEVALDSVVAVRDRVIGAYQDIMRMQI